ncbi:MAG: hypothetical protein HY654_09070 [Acidobacteria bacterium]|nr:hypothetical protein [Acidobacteriota bacterium]
MLPTSEREAELYPAFLKLAGRKVVIVGGGPVAAAKLAALRAAGAHVVVVAPEIAPEIRRQQTNPESPPSREALRRGSPKFAVAEGLTANEGGRIPNPEIRCRFFQPADLNDAWFVVAAATPEVNRAVAAAAAERRVFVNAVDDPQNATAYLGGVVRRSGVTVAVSTSGTAPALAGLIREALELLLPDDLDRWLDEARRRRRAWKARGVPMSRRRPLLLNALNSLYGRSASREAGR